MGFWEGYLPIIRRPICELFPLMYSHVITFHFHKEWLNEEFLKSDNKGEEDG